MEEQIFESMETDVYSPLDEEPVVSAEYAEKFGQMYQTALPELSDAEKSFIQERIQFGEEDIVREEFAASRNASLEGVVTDSIKASIAEGDVAGATALIENRGVGKEDPRISLETAVSERIIATRLNSDADNEELDLVESEKFNLTVAMVNMALARAGAEFTKKYGDLSEWGPAIIQAMSAGPTATPDRPIDPEKLRENLQKIGSGATPAQIFSFVTDLAAMILIQTPFAFGKRLRDNTAAAFLTTLMPGTSSGYMADFLWNPDTDIFQKKMEFERYVDELGKSFASNPLKFMTALYDTLTVGQGEVPEWLARARDIKQYTIVNEKGEIEVRENALYGKDKPLFGEDEEYTFFDPDNSLFDAALANRFVSSALDTPLWDKFLLGKMLNPLKAMYGAHIAGRIGANLIKSGKAPQTFRIPAMTQLTAPGVVTDPETLASIQQGLAILDGALAEAVTVPRVNVSLDPVTLAEEQAKILNLLPKGFHQNTQIVHDGGNTYFRTNLRSPSGNEFVDAKFAQRFINNHGLINAKIVHNARTNRYFVTVDHAIDETRFLEKGLPTYFTKRGSGDVIGDFISVLRDNKGGRRVLSPQSLTPDLAITGGVPGTLEIGKFAKAFENSQRVWLDLANAEVEAVKSVINFGKKAKNPTDPSQRGRWYTEAEFIAAFQKINRRAPSKKEVQAYFSYRAGSDFAYGLMNARKRDEIVAAGGNQFTLTDNILDWPVLARIHDGSYSDRAIVYIGNGKYLTGAEARRVRKANPDMVSLAVIGRAEVGNRQVSHVLFPKEAVKAQGVPAHVLGYTEGGTRNYKYVNFVKNALQDGGEATLGIFRTPEQAQKFASTMNSILAQYKAFKAEMEQMRIAGTWNPASRRALRLKHSRVIQGLHPMWWLDNVEAEIAMGRLNPDKPVLYRHDREKMPDSPFDTEILQNAVQRKGRLYYSERGDFLTDDMLNLTELDDPLEALARQQSHAARAKGFGDFIIKEVAQWDKRFGKYLKVDEGLAFPTPYERFMTGRWMEGISHELPPHIRNQAEAEREYIKRMMHVPETVEDLGSVNRHIERAKFIAGAFGNSELAQKHFELLATGKIYDPAAADQFVRGSVFNLHLAVGALRQVWLQASGAEAALILHPLYAIASAKDFPLLRLAMASNSNPHVVAAIDRAVSKLDIKGKRLYAPGDFTKIMDDYRRTGLDNVDKTNVLMDRAQVINGLTSQIDQLNDIGRIPFHEGDRIARMITFGIARRVAIEKINKGELPFKIGSNEYIKWIQGETGRYLQTMIGGGEPWYQRKPGISTVMQFMQYPMKLTELVLGFNRTFTAKEKATLILSYTALHGAYGIIPFAPEAVDYFMEKDARQGEHWSEEKYLTLQLGLVDLASRTWGGEEWKTAFAADIGTGDFLASKWALISDDRWGGLLGPAYADLTKLNGIRKDIWRLFAAIDLNSGEPTMLTTSAEALGELTTMISSMNTTSKALYIDAYAAELNSKGIPIESDSKFNAFLAGLGIKSTDELISWRIRSIQLDRQKMLREVAAQIAAIQVRADLIAQKEGYNYSRDLREMVLALKKPYTPEERELLMNMVGQMVKPIGDKLEKNKLYPLKEGSE